MTRIRIAIAVESGALVADGRPPLLPMILFFGSLAINGSKPTLKANGQRIINGTRAVYANLHAIRLLGVTIPTAKNHAMHRSAQASPLR